jgi:hypothetical protein
VYEALRYNNTPVEEEELEAKVLCAAGLLMEESEGSADCIRT